MGFVTVPVQLVMANPRTFASVTDVNCTCGYLQRAADDPSLPIIFEPLTSEFQFVYGQPEPGGPSSVLIIYHCPFCGGAAPESKRSLLFAVVSSQEEQRLAKLLARLRTIRGVLKRLGKPERDDRDGTQIRNDESDGNAPSSQWRRTLVYERLSDVADVWITERRDGSVSWSLVGKYIGGKPSGGHAE